MHSEKSSIRPCSTPTLSLPIIVMFSNKISTSFRSLLIIWMKLPDCSLEKWKEHFQVLSKNLENTVHPPWKLQTPGGDGGGSSTEFAEEASGVAAGPNCEEDKDDEDRPIASQKLALAMIFFYFRDATTPSRLCTCDFEIPARVYWGREWKASKHKLWYRPTSKEKKH